MSAFSRLVLVSTIVLSVAANLAPNTVADANLQADNLYRCWEPVDQHNDGSGYTLSKPVFRFCSYMPGDSFDKFYVNGVQEESDDYTQIMQIFRTSQTNYAVINICLQEAFQFARPPQPSQTSIRCLCRRDGCNIPKPMQEFFQFNKKIIPLQ